MVQLNHLRKWRRRIRVGNATERNLAFVLSELNRMESALGLSRNVRETAAIAYRKAAKKNLIRGQSIEGIAAAVLYAACRQTSTSPIDYVPRLCSTLNLYGEVQSKTIEILGQASGKEITADRSPTSMVAAAIYIASIRCDRRTQSEIAKVAGVTEVTIRNRYKEMAGGQGFENFL
jgi:transcription initiation factor TFIIB